MSPRSFFPRRPARDGTRQSLAEPLRRAARGFTLLELSIVLFIISVVAALAVPAFKQVQLNARSGAVMNDLRVFTGAFQAYAHDRGDWPPGDGTPGGTPSAMQGYLGVTSWERVTPIGGRYVWAPNTLQQGERYRAAIVISTVADNRVTADRKQLDDIDRKIDDADLDTGNFRLGYRNYPVFVIEH